MTTKGPDACLRDTLTPICLPSTVITISCLLYSALVTLWWYYFEYIPTIISSLHYSGSANFDGFISVQSCFPTVKLKNLYQFNPRSYDTGDYIQNIDPCKTWQQLDNGLYIYIHIYIFILRRLGNGWCIKMIYPCCVGVIYPCFVGVINPAQFAW